LRELSLWASIPEVWQRFAGKWATGDAGQKPCAAAAQPLLILQGFLTRSLEWPKITLFGQHLVGREAVFQIPHEKLLLP
jgi:hypothetical protein